MRPSVHPRSGLGGYRWTLALAAVAPVAGRPPTGRLGSSCSRALRRLPRLPRGQSACVTSAVGGTCSFQYHMRPRPGAGAVPRAASHVQRARADARAVARLINRATAAQARDSVGVGPDRTPLAVLHFNTRRIWRPPACRNRVANVSKMSARHRGSFPHVHVLELPRTFKLAAPMFWPVPT
jgi:hypothetical protein